MSDIKHILFLARWYPNRYDPMFGLFVRRHAEAAAMENKISVVYAHMIEKPTAEKYELITSEIENLFEVNVYYRSSNLIFSPIRKLINIFRFFNAVRIGKHATKLKQGQVQIIHVHVLTRLALLALWYRMVNGIPYLLTEHWSRYLPIRNEFHGFWRKMLTRVVVKHAAAVTTVTENLAQAMQKHGLKSRKYVVLSNVVDVNLFHPIQKTKNEKKRIVHISCFEDRSKNISGLLRVINQLKQQRHDFECVLIGEGMDLQLLQDYAFELGLGSESIQFTGLLEGEDLAKTLASGDFLVLFSNFENMPVVILEAFACGLPVLATNVGGIPEIIQPNNGLLVDAADEKALLASMSIMLDHLADYDSLTIRSQVENKNSKEAVSLFLSQLYKSILS